jgi:putative Ca2+/H+ antiporter (TMEM165/GDT1 family)
MSAFLISLSTVAVAEMGDRTQFLALMLAARFRRPWAIMAGILLATLADNLAAAALGSWFGHRIAPAFLDALVGCSLTLMALWTIFAPDEAENAPKISSRGAFLTTLCSFFLAELGDKTQIATLALAAAYPNLLLVVAGSTAGLLLANAPVVFLGDAFAHRIPLSALRYAAVVLFLGLGAFFVIRASQLCWPPLSVSCF